MKPYVICHMVASVDGRILHGRWRPHTRDGGDLFERLHIQLGGDAWLVGRVTGQEFARSRAYETQADRTCPREPWLVRRDADRIVLGTPKSGANFSAGTYGVVLDAHGKIAWGRSEIGGDPIVVVLTEQVSDAHLAGLRQDGVSYFFAGEKELDLRSALEFLDRELGVKRLLIEGGGGSNGSFLRAGLVDEISLAICPAVDGAKGAPSVFDSSAEEANLRAPIAEMSLASCEVLDGGAVWLRYRVRNEKGLVRGPLPEQG
ncbi:MAG: dihydrofolate reductase family protein [Steroidobacteraceae bacterium]